MSDSSSSLATRWRQISNKVSERTRRVTKTRTFRALSWSMVAVVVVPGILYGFPQLTGSDHAFLVLSGSMVPAFDPGDVIFVSNVDADDVAVGDIITFRAKIGSSTLFTHRVIEVLEDGGRTRWRTQGDANEDPDPFVVHPEMLVGRYDFQIPYWGHLVNAIRSKAGYVLFILLPAAIVILREFVKLYHELDAADRARKASKTGEPDP